MRVHLELEYEDSFHFATVNNTLAGACRNFTAKVDGRTFACWYRLDGYMASNPNYMKNVDDLLTGQFEEMLGKLFKAAVKSIPENFDLMTATDEGVSQALMSVRP